MERKMDMDFREPERQPSSEPAQQPVSISPPPKRGGRGKRWLKFLVVLLLIVGAAAGAYYWRDSEAKKEAKSHAAETSQLQRRITQLQAELSGAEEDAAKQSGPSEETLKKVEDAVKSGKYADTQSLMADKVVVIQAASEGLGRRTPEQAVADLKYLDGGSDPWDFALTSTVVSGYQDGDYAQYFPLGALVGKSANDYVVSFVFNNSGKVSVIFMANKADIL